MITVVSNSGPVNEGSPATIKVTATDPDNPAAKVRALIRMEPQATWRGGVRCWHA